MSLFKRGVLSFIIVFVLAACCLMVPAYFIYQNARSLVTSQVSNNAIDIAASVASFVEKDIEEFKDSPVYVYAPEAGGFLPELSDSQSEEPYPADSGEGGAGSSYDGLAYDGGPPAGGVELTLGSNMRSPHADTLSMADANGSAGAALVPGSGVTEPEKSSLDEEYLNDISALLVKIKTETGAANIYIEKKVSEVRKGYVLKPDRLTPDHMTSDLTEDELRAFNDGISSSSDVINDSALGDYLRGYAPVLNTRTGLSEGVVVVEFLLSDAVNLMAGVSHIIISCFAIIVFLITFVVHRLLTSRAKYLFTDYLTSLSNRRYFERYLPKMIRRAKKKRQSLSMMMIDIDHFKSINDTMGHAMGDTVLEGVSAALKRRTRRSDACCRFGGDEFAMILPRATGEQAAAIAERIRRETANLKFDADNRTFGVTLSIGVAELAPEMTANKLIDMADQSMYLSKNGGKNKTSVYGCPPEVPAEAAEAWTLS